MRFLSLSVLFLFTTLVLAAQESIPFSQIRQYLQQDSLAGRDTGKRNPLYSVNGLHYLQPLYRDLIEGLTAKSGTNSGASNVAQHLAFAGDYERAAVYGSRDYDSLPASAYRDILNFTDTLHNLTYVNAREFVLKCAASEQVLMINESRHIPAHRAFTISLLQSLYNLGYRYLAMDILNNRSDKKLTELDMRTGYFASEPVAGELLRQARELGFTLIAYEDTLADSHTVSGRDALQASRIAAIFQKDPAAKILITAGSAHISEQKIGNYIPMALAFRKITGINPFTIDQTELTEGSTFEYGRYLYQNLALKIKLGFPAIAFKNGAPYSLLENDLYDVQVIHPATILKHNRPEWLSLSGQRKEVAVQPTEKSLFLVQAYYQEETRSKPLPVLIPADQTYISDNDGYYWLYLRPGNYNLVHRNIAYKVLSQKTITVSP